MRGDENHRSRTEQDGELHSHRLNPAFVSLGIICCLNLVAYLLEQSSKAKTLSNETCSDGLSAVPPTGPVGLAVCQPTSDFSSSQCRH